jgi:hypothetical protein
VDRIAGILEVSRTDNTHEIVISHLRSKANSDSLSRVVIAPRYARHLANVLLDHAKYDEAEALGFEPKSRPYRRKIDKLNL